MPTLDGHGDPHLDPAAPVGQGVDGDLAPGRVRQLTGEGQGRSLAARVGLVEGEVGPRGPDLESDAHRSGRPFDQPPCQQGVDDATEPLDIDEDLVRRREDDGHVRGSVRGRLAAS